MSEAPAGGLVHRHLRVIDLSWGVAGPMVAMMLGDHGATVTRIERPAGDPFVDLSGYRVWQRGKETVVLDLASDEGRGAFFDLASDCDVIVESFAPGVTDRLGIDFASVHERFPWIVYCTITGYGIDGPDADRPAYDPLVAARTGQMWESRGVDGGTLSKLAGLPPLVGDIDVPDDLRVGPARPGPLFSAIPWCSLGAFYLASVAVNAALLVRASTGRGQWVRSSLLQGALLSTIYPWQKAERGNDPDFQSWVIDPRAPRGLFECADGRWVHQWQPLPNFMIESSRGDHLEQTANVTSPRNASFRISHEPGDMFVLHYYIPLMRDAAARFTSQEWTEFAAAVGVPLQAVRSPEEALADDALLADGCVVEQPDSAHGTIRSVGTTVRLSACPPTVSENSEDRRPPAPAQRAGGGLVGTGDDRAAVPAAPLEGVVVLDLGLAVAMPYGAQILAELGATVIKVQAPSDRHWMSIHIGMSCNRHKRSIIIDLKSDEGMAVFRDLVQRADVFMTNMRYSAAERLGLGYPALRALNERLIYCHGRGFDTGARQQSPGNDQTVAALSGVEWVEGAMDAGGTPIWPVTSLGDSGAGLLAAIGVLQALLHRHRTGEGQFVDTSIVNAHLLNSSMAWLGGDGTRGQRPLLDPMLLGVGPLCRLYETADGWLCLAAVTETHWQLLVEAVGQTAWRTDPRFVDAGARSEHADELVTSLESIVSTRTSAQWFEILDGCGVPCEIADEDAVLRIFDDQRLKETGWVGSFEHPRVGRIETAGLLFDLSETPGRLTGPSPIAGQHTVEILSELGYDSQTIDGLLRRGVVQRDGEHLPL